MLSRKSWYSRLLQIIFREGIIPGGGTRIIFWRGVRPEVWNPYPYLRIFLPQKTADLKLFFEIFANRDPFLRVFLPQNGWFYHFFAIFAKWDPLLRIFLTKMGPMSKDFCWKSNPFGRHIPVCLNMWVPPPGDYKGIIGVLAFTLSTAIVSTGYSHLKGHIKGVTTYVFINLLQRF